MKLWDFHIFRLLLFLIPGILSGFYFSVSPAVIATALLCLFPLFGWFYIRYSGHATHRYLFGGTAFAITFLIGFLAVSMKNPENDPRHYGNYSGHSDPIAFIPVKQLKPGAQHYRYEVRVRSINGHKVSGRMLLYVEKDSTMNRPLTGRRYETTSTPREIAPPRNPHEFHYADYLKKQYIHHSISVRPDELVFLSGREYNIYALAAAFREKVYSALQKYGFHGDVLAVINALILGQRQDISEAVYHDYADAGAIHILAVSGLHVGILFLILNFLLGPVERLRHGRVLKFILIVAALWGFAFIAGLSASVVRAVTMFSFVALAFQFRRASDTCNVLMVSMFLLLLVRPGFLFDTGFQLSYAAVFAIIWLQPLFYSYWKPRWKAVDYLWKLTTVSAAAQLGVLPLGLFYFHQFPGLFFLSNLVIVPLLGLILGGGILVIALALAQVLPSFLADGYMFIIRGMNLFVSRVAGQEHFVFRDIPFDWKLLLLSYVLLGILGLFLQKPTWKKIPAGLISVLLLYASVSYDRYKVSATEKLVVFHKNRHSLIGKQEGNKLVAYHSPEADMPEDLSLKSYVLAEGVREIRAEKLQERHEINGRVLWYINGTELPESEIKADYIVLGNSPKINLERLLLRYCPQVVIADGSNYKYLVKRWEASCKKEKIPFHNTYEKGAFIVEN